MASLWALSVWKAAAACADAGPPAYACVAGVEPAAASTSSAGGALSISGFSPSGVSCANGYTGSVSYTVCGSAGAAYSVSGCEAACIAPSHVDAHQPTSMPESEPTPSDLSADPSARVSADSKRLQRRPQCQSQRRLQATSAPTPMPESAHSAPTPIPESVPNPSYLSADPVSRVNRRAR